ncbi:hypothetical protein Tco_0580630 [Tanacetum coccineum]
MAFIHLKLKKDVVLVKGFNKVESWTFQISFAELLLSCSSAEPLDEGTYIIHHPLKLVLRGNIDTLCGVCFAQLFLAKGIIRGMGMANSVSGVADLRHALHLVLNMSSKECSECQIRVQICVS